MIHLPPVQRSRLWLAAGLALAALGWSATAAAQDYPSKAVKIVVPFGPGGAGDLTARAVGAQLSTLWGKPVVIENKPGAGGVVAADSVVKADPDGHTLFLMSNGTAVTQALFQNLPFDTVRDLAPVSTLGYFDIVVVVPEGSPFKTFGELLTYAKANPGKLNIGSINVGSTQNLAAELFKSTAGIQGQVVPFNGTPALINALRGNQVDVGVEILGPVLTQIKANAPDLLVSDIGMPGMDGYEVARRLRADPRTRDLHCIALSADAMADQIQAARDAGFADYWTKPIDLGRLLDAVAKALEQGHASA